MYSGKNNIIHILQRWQALATIGALQTILHPALQTGCVENMSTRSDHVQPSGQHERTAGARDIAVIARLDDWNFQVLHTNRTVECALAFALIFELPVLEGVTTTGGIGTRN